MRSSSSLAHMGLADAREGLARRAFTSMELTAAVLGAIRARDGRVRAYTHVDEDDALAQARDADAARAAGDPRPLLGIPVAIKDNLNVRGQPCTCGSRILAGYRAPYDAGSIARLRAAGCLPVGRTNLDEFAMGSTTETSAHGPTRNPWNLDRVPGGSSGGSAAAVASHTAVAALGTDTGGSIRQPAAFCGCVGLKPTYGRVSRYGAVAFASSLDQVGPITRTVEDAALLLGAIAGPDPHDSTCLDAPVPDYAAACAGGWRGLRIGLPREYFIPGMDPDVEAAVRAAVDLARAGGATIVDLSLPHTPLAVACYYLIATAEASANLARFDGVRYGLRVPADDPIEQYGRTRAAGFGAEVKRRIILGTYALSSGYYDAYYLQAQKVRTLIRRDFDAAFRQCDVLMTPVAPTAAYAFGAGEENPLQLYLGDIFTIPVNLAGLCALSLPCGLTSAGLPVGLQIIGPVFGEEAVLRAGRAMEDAVGKNRHVAPLALADEGAA